MSEKPTKKVLPIPEANQILQKIKVQKADQIQKRTLGSDYTTSTVSRPTRASQAHSCQQRFGRRFTYQTTRPPALQPNMLSSPALS